MPTHTRTSAPAPFTILAAVGSLLLASIGLVATTAIPANAADPVDKISYCHATESAGNPYVEGIDTSVDTFFQAGHGDHPDDIVPPFSYIKQGVLTDFPGTNWDAEGQAIFAYGCDVPTPGISASPQQCTTPFGDSGGVSITVTDLVPNYSYTVSVASGGNPIPGVTDQTFVATSTSEVLDFSGLPAPGDYEATVSNDSNNDDASIEFTLAACPTVSPTLQVTPEQCDVPFGDSAAVSVSVGDLYPGHNYTVELFDDTMTLIDSENLDGSNPTAIVDFSGLPAPGSYTVVVTDVAEQLSASQEFSLDLCPVVIPSVALTPHECTVPGGDSADVDVTLTSLLVGTQYTVSIVDAADNPVGTDQTFTATTDGEVLNFIVPAPGSYTVTVTDDDHPDTSASSEFSVEACPILVPELSITPEQCTVRGGDSGSIEVTVENLMIGTQYTVTIVDDADTAIPGVDPWTFTADETSESETFALPAGMQYTVTVVDDDHAENSAETTVWLDPCPLLVPTIGADPETCLTVGGDSSTATLTLGELTPGESYLVTVTDAEGAAVPGIDPVQFVATSATDELVVSDLPAPGSYRAQIDWVPGEEEATDDALTAFALTPCPELIFQLPTLALTGAVRGSDPLVLGGLLLAIGVVLTVVIRPRRDVGSPRQRRMS